MRETGIIDNLNRKMQAYARMCEEIFRIRRNKGCLLLCGKLCEFEGTYTQEEWGMYQDDIVKDNSPQYCTKLSINAFLSQGLAVIMETSSKTCKMPAS